jgi:hypothetical protein
MFLIHLYRSSAFLFTLLPLSSQKFSTHGKEIVCIKLDPLFCFCSCLCGILLYADGELHYCYLPVYLLLFRKSVGFDLNRSLHFHIDARCRTATGFFVFLPCYVIKKAPTVSLGLLNLNSLFTTSPLQTAHLLHYRLLHLH